MSDLAAVAATSKQTLYGRLGGKETIFRSVLEREAALLVDWLAESYQHSIGLSLRDQAEASTLSFFRFARTRTPGMELLLGKRGGPTNTIARDLVAQVTSNLATLLMSVERGSSSGASPQDHLLAAACVGVGRQVLEHALDHDLDLEDAGRVATDYIESAIQGMRMRPIVL